MVELPLSGGPLGPMSPVSMVAARGRYAPRFSFTLVCYS